MSVRQEGGVVFLEGDCPVEDAEPLLAALLGGGPPVVDWSGCASLHTAVLQVLLAVRPELRGSPGEAFLQKWVRPILAIPNKAISCTG